MGIEPTALPWEGRVLPLYDARIEVFLLPVLARNRYVPQIQPTGSFQGTFYQGQAVIRGIHRLVLTYAHFLGS